MSQSVPNADRWDETGSFALWVTSRSCTHCSTPTSVTRVLELRFRCFACSRPCCPKEVIAAAQPSGTPHKAPATSSQSRWHARSTIPAVGSSHARLGSAASSPHTGEIRSTASCWVQHRRRPPTSPFCCRGTNFSSWLQARAHQWLAVGGPGGGGGGKRLHSHPPTDSQGSLCPRCFQRALLANHSLLHCTRRATKSLSARKKIRGIERPRSGSGSGALLSHGRVHTRAVRKID